MRHKGSIQRSSKEALILCQIAGAAVRLARVVGRADMPLQVGQLDKLHLAKRARKNLKKDKRLLRIKSVHFNAKPLNKQTTTPTDTASLQAASKLAYNKPANTKNC